MPDSLVLLLVLPFVVVKNQNNGISVLVRTPKQFYQRD